MTLLELVTVIVIIGILAVMLFPAIAGIRGKAERSNCANNLRNLYVATNSYVQEHQTWPQIGSKLIDSKTYATPWIKALEPYGISRINWLCPTVQRSLGNPDFNDEKNIRVDYFATRFGSHVSAPFRWPTHPWFIEKGDVHGDGNLLIFANGQVKSLNEVRRDTKRQIVH